MDASSEAGSEKNAKDGTSTATSEDEPPQKARKYTQILASLIVTIGCFMFGSSLAWSAPAIPVLDEEICHDSCDIPDISEEDASWISSLMPLGGMLAGPTAGYLLHHIGRKYTMMVMYVPICIGYMFFVIANAVEHEELLYVGRFLTGFGAASFTLTCAIYINETAESRIRGSLSTIVQIMISLGIVFVNALNIEMFATWDIISLILMIIPVVGIVLLFLIPETPYYLMLRSKEDKAAHSLHWFRGKHYDISEEVSKTHKLITKQQHIKKVHLKALLTTGVYWKPLVVTIVLLFFQQFSGINAVTFNVQIIFKAADTGLSSSLSAFIVSIPQLLGALCLIPIVDRVGRRIILMVTQAVMGISIMALAVYFYIEDNTEILCPEVSLGNSSTTSIPPMTTTELCIPREGKFSQSTLDSLAWLPLLSLFFYMFAFTGGVSPLPYAINAEIHLPEAKGLSAPICSGFNWLFAFLVTKFFFSYEALVTLQGTFFTFAIINFLGLLFTLFILPETRHKTPHEISLYFDKRRASLMSFQEMGANVDEDSKSDSDKSSVKSS